MIADDQVGDTAGDNFRLKLSHVDIRYPIISAGQNSYCSVSISGSCILIRITLRLPFTSFFELSLDEATCWRINDEGEAMPPSDILSSQVIASDDRSTRNFCQRRNKNIRC